MIIEAQQQRRALGSCCRGRSGRPLSSAAPTNQPTNPCKHPHCRAAPSVARQPRSRAHSTAPPAAAASTAHTHIHHPLWCSSRSWRPLPCTPPTPNWRAPAPSTFGRRRTSRTSSTCSRRSRRRAMATTRTTRRWCPAATTTWSPCTTNTCSTSSSSTTTITTVPCCSRSRTSSVTTTRNTRRPTATACWAGAAAAPTPGRPPPPPAPSRCPRRGSIRRPSRPENPRYRLGAFHTAFVYLFYGQHVGWPKKATLVYFWHCYDPEWSELGTNDPKVFGYLNFLLWHWSVKRKLRR